MKGKRTILGCRYPRAYATFSFLATSFVVVLTCETVASRAPRRQDEAAESLTSQGTFGIFFSILLPSKMRLFEYKIGGTRRVDAETKALTLISDHRLCGLGYDKLDKGISHFPPAEQCMMVHGFVMLPRNDSLFNSYDSLSPEVQVCNSAYSEPRTCGGQKLGFKITPAGNTSVYHNIYAGEMGTLSIDDFVAASRMVETEKKLSTERLKLDRLRKAQLTTGDIAGYSPFMFRKLNKSENVPKGAARSAIRDPEYRWPRGEIPYVLSRTYYSRDRQLIARAMDEFQQKTCVRFVPRDPQRHYDYVYVEPDDGCYSMIGRMGGSQPLSLTDDCMELGIIVHELMHAVGFIHEHSRTDRDQYVRIIWRNILPGTEEEFEKYTSSEVDNNGFSYDYGSIMHYDNLAFSRNGRPTIEAKQKAKESIMGQRDDFSSLDMQKINKLYGCSSSFQTAGPFEETGGNIFGGPTELVGSLCLDFNGHCRSWATAGYCTLPTHQIYMAATCPAACGFC